MRKFLLGFILIFLANASFAQKKVTLSGYIKDAKDGEALIGAVASIPSLEGVGVASNVYGFYSLSVPAGTYEVRYSFIGYKSLVKNIELNESQTLDVELSEEGDTLDEVVISDVREDANVSSIEMSVNKLDISIIQKIPALLGEVDIIKSIQLLPGVSTVGEGATGFNVRGGGVGQNLVLLDDAPVYNSSHLFGFFSVFNPDAVKDVKLIKGGIPAQYGGRQSSILDIRMKEGNSKRFAASGGVGVIFSRLTLEAPIIKDKASFIVAARRSYIDILARPFLNEDLRDSKFNFYDLTAKVNYRINANNQLFLSGYLGRDVFDASNVFKSNWGNQTATLRWNHIFNERLFFNLTAFYSNYDYSLGFGDTAEDQFTWESEIINYSLKPEFTYYLNPNNEITFGGQAILYDFVPAAAQGTSAGEVRDVSLPNQYALEGGVYIGNKQTLSDKISLQYGLRWSYFNYMGKGTKYEFAPNTENPAGRREPIDREGEKFDQWESIQTYDNLEPRFSIKYQVNSSTSLKASYNRMVQYIHLISNTVASTPLDVWTPSTNNIRPQIADQVALGVFKNFQENAWETSLEVYYKDYQNIVDYIDNADLLINPFLEGDLLSGIGRSYGAEFYVKRNQGKFNGWVSYTLARTERKVEGLNNNDWFSNRFDQTHNLKLVAFYEPNERWSFSTNFVLITGTPATFPTNRIELQGYVIPHNSQETRNNFRIPAYHRLDLSATLHGKKFKKNGAKRKNEDYWVFSVYNVYNRRNPFSVTFGANEDNPRITEATRFSVVGSFIPAVSYNFKF